MAWSPPFFFSSPGTMLMGAHYGGVEHHVFVVVIGSQHIEDALKNAAFGPAVKALPDRFPATEPFGQIPPRDAGAVAEDYRFDK